MEKKFELTAEEVETTRFALEVAIEKNKAFYHERFYQLTFDDKSAFERVIYSERNLLRRVKQWQDENTTNKGTESTSD